MAAPRTYRIGFLGGQRARADALVARLRELGYVEGENLSFDFRGSAGGSSDLLAQWAADVVQLDPDVIVCGSEIGLEAGMRATSTIPLVMASISSDPIGLGYVASLARPGGNVTGFTDAPPETDLKRLQLLVEGVPGTRVVAILRLGVAGRALGMEAWAAAAQSLGVEVQHIAGPGGASSDWEAAFAAAVEQGADAVLVLHGPSSVGNISTIASLATEHRLPAIHALKLFTDRGGLMAYEARSSEIVPHVADYVDRILHGARPAELPVELPSHYDLIVNLQAARALGLTFSRDFLARVDEVIE